MASGPIHPNEQLKKRSGSIQVMNGTANRTEIIVPNEQATQPPVAHGSGPIGPHEQAAVTVGGDIVDSPAPASAAAKSRSKNGAGKLTDAAMARRLRFNVSLQAKLSKQTDFSVCVFSPDRNRGPVTIESIHVSVYRKGDSMFDGDVPVRKEAKVNPGTKQILPFTAAQQKELSRATKSKTFVLVSAVYTAPAQSEVTFSIENQDSSKK
ncbi:MAG: hypothetical protein ACJ746_27295 [Bryobacteraceae bacterium]